MATSLLDVRDTLAASPVRSAGRVVAPVSVARRLPPAAVVAAAAIGVLEALGLLAVGVTSLDGLLVSPTRPAGWVVALALGVLAAWVVAGAASGVTVVDGAGRRSVIVLCFAELLLVGSLFVVATTTPLILTLPGDLPPAALALLAAAVPVGKLLLVGSPSATAWVAAGSRTPRESRPDPVAAHRLLCTLTVVGIGLSLTALALLTPTQAGPGADVASIVSTR